MSDTRSGQELARLMIGGWIAQAVYVAAELGIADLLVDGPRTAEDLAGRTNTHAAALYRVLRALASMLAETVRSGELVARWGGEEFILLLADEGASERAEALRRTLADQAIHAGGARLHVTASIGLSPAAYTGTLDERLTAADRALYRAKQQGRNCVVVAAA